MSAVFGDVFYWIALIDPGDKYAREVRRFDDLLSGGKVYTTEEVLVEVLTFFAADSWLSLVLAPAPRPVLKTRRMDEAPITIRRYTDFDEMKADEYRYWQSRPAHERLDAVEEMIETAYALKGWEIEADVPRLQRPFVRLPVPWR